MKRQKERAEGASAATSGYRTETNARDRVDSHPEHLGDHIADAAAACGETAALKRIIKALKDKRPEVARAIGW